MPVTVTRLARRAAARLRVRRVRAKTATAQNINAATGAMLTRYRDRRNTP
jgi:hypothetical protein